MGAGEYIRAGEKKGKVLRKKKETCSDGAMLCKCVRGMTEAKMQMMRTRKKRKTDRHSRPGETVQIIEKRG